MLFVEQPKQKSRLHHKHLQSLILQYYIFLKVQKKKYKLLMIGVNMYKNSKLFS